MRCRTRQIRRPCRCTEGFQSSADHSHRLRVLIETRDEAAEAGDTPSPILVTKDVNIGRITADVVPAKGAPACIAALERALVDSGHAKLVLKSDDEPAINALGTQTAAVMRAKHGPAWCRHSV
eukprot:99570-Amphidinium_carterae.1